MATPSPSPQALMLRRDAASKGTYGALDGCHPVSSNLRIPGVADCLDAAGLGPSYNRSKEESWP
jgi:hypothetical protein